jgi:hypothetical protein
VSEIQIVKVEPVGPAVKAVHPWNRYDRYRVEVRYTMADGSQHTTGEWFGLLRDAKSFVGAGAQFPTNKLAWYDGGRFSGVVENVRIGGAR